MVLKIIGKAINLNTKAVPDINPLSHAKLSQLKADTFTSTIKQIPKLSAEEKIQLLAKKCPCLTTEQLENPIFRENIDLATAIANHFGQIGYSQYNGLTKHSYKNISPKIVSFFSNTPGSSGQSTLSRFLVRGFPVYLADETYRLQQSMKHIPSVSPKLNLGNIEKGKEVLNWYQTNFQSGILNNALRGGKNYEELPIDAKTCLEFLDNHQRALGSPKILIRGTNEFDIPYSKLKPGDTFTDKGFISTMEAEGMEYNLEDFVFGKHFLLIKAPSKTNAIVPADWTGGDAMQEIILPRNTKFKVLSNVNLPDYGNRAHKPILDRRLLTLEIVE